MLSTGWNVEYLIKENNNKKKTNQLQQRNNNAIIQLFETSIALRIEQ